eukprot:1344659-Amorphochlora_amoeboformis.AAC.1
MNPVSSIKAFGGLVQKDRVLGGGYGDGWGDGGRLDGEKPMDGLRQLAKSSCVGAIARHLRASASLNCEMTYTVFLPSIVRESKAPVLYYLSGLTCTPDNFITKVGFVREYT